MRLLALPKFFGLLITHMKGWIGGKYFSRWSLCFGLFVCPCYSAQRTLNLTPEMPSAQIIAAFGNQGKQSELSDYWKSIKTLSLKK